MAAPGTRRYPLALLLAFVAIWLALAIRPVSRIDWALENILVVLFVAFLIATRRSLPLSNLSYTLIFVYLVLHEVGAHYTYSLVPIDWGALGFSRNHYDRVVHFAFGLLLALPMREWFRTVAQARGVWSYYLPLDVILASSVAYEVIEWIVAGIVDPAAGIAYLGAQGDDFDAVKDMACGGAGALLAMGAAMLVHWRREPGFRAELRASLRIPVTQPMGEVDRRRWKGEAAPQKPRVYPKVALALLVLAWIVSGIGAIQPFDWFLESILVMLFVPVLVFTYKRFPLSDLSYTLILIFLCLHLVGAHWAYGAVPIPWEAWGFERNHYDRVVHFSFGLLMAYPIREAFYRIANARGFWGFFLPLDVTLSFSAVYEMIEWVVAMLVSPEAGAAFVGAQGDLFDPIKDMALAGTGAILAMGITAWMNWRHNPGFRDELRASLPR